MSKVLGSERLGRLLSRQQSNVGESRERERAPEVVGTSTRLGTSLAAPQTVDLYSTAGPTGIKVIAHPANATLEYDPKPRYCVNHF